MCDTYHYLNMDPFSLPQISDTFHCLNTWSLTLLTHTYSIHKHTGTDLLVKASLHLTGKLRRRYSRWTLSKVPWVLDDSFRHGPALFLEKIMDCSILSRGYFLWKKILTLIKCNHFCPGFVCYDNDLLKATQTNKITQPHAKAPTDKRTLQTLAHLSLLHVCAYSHIHTFVPQNPSSTQLWPALCPNARDK